MLGRDGDGMEIRSAAAVESTEAVEGAHLQRLAGGERANVQRFVIDPGAVVPEHSHPHEQVGYVIEGELTFTVDGEERVVGEGDSYVLAGDEPHRAENRGADRAIGLDVFSPPRDDPDWEE